MLYSYGLFERENPGQDEENDVEIIAMKTPPFKIKHNSSYKRIMSDAIIYLNQSISEMNLHGSGWNLIEVLMNPSCIFSTSITKVLFHIYRS